jgi:hypothetical protein
MRKRYRYDKETKELIPLDQWLAKYETRDSAHHVIPDLQPYMAVAGDMAGKWITSRREHRAFLKRNRFEEVGNERAYMERNRGMSDDNPNLVKEHVVEERICRSLSQSLDRLRR